jgi:hypothetical protein
MLLEAGAEPGQMIYLRSCLAYLQFINHVTEVAYPESEEEEYNP